MNIDYSLCQALQRVEVIKKVLFIYDIGCEWGKHFWDQVEASNYLHLDKDLEIITTVGKFHLGAHIKECFALFSLNFVQGVGQLDGEILESQPLAKRPAIPEECLKLIDRKLLTTT